MPDVFTFSPMKLREMMVEAGAVCGAEPRVFIGRDPFWTCQVDSKGWLRDMYIHDMSELHTSSFYWHVPVLMVIGGIFLGLLWGKRFWRDSAVYRGEHLG